MRIAVCSLVYNEVEFVRQCFNNWKDEDVRHVFLVSSRAWNGSPQEDDGTVDLLKKLGAEYYLRYWETEHEQRNWALGLLQDYDYVLQVDPDELYEKSEIKKILNRLNDPYDYVNRIMKPIPVFRLARMITYWKDYRYILDPPDLHQTILAVDPKRIRFFSLRNVESATKDGDETREMPLIDVTCHHFSWAKSNEKIKEKIQSYSHSDIIPSEWYENVWSKWEENSQIKVRPYGSEGSIAIKKEAPQEIQNLLKM